jgi:hypothetical protein
VHERLHDPDLLAVSPRELPNRAVEHDPETLAERVTEGCNGATQANQRLPAAGLIRSSSSLIVVLLPAPFGPR